MPIKIEIIPALTMQHARGGVLRQAHAFFTSNQHRARREELIEVADAPVGRSLGDGGQFHTRLLKGTKRCGGRGILGNLNPQRVTDQGCWSCWEMARRTHSWDIPFGGRQIRSRPFCCPG